MSTGKFINGKVELSTEFCKEKDIEKLINALKYSFGLVCSIDKCKKNLYVVIISKEYVKIFQDIVSPYIIPTMKYKIGYTIARDTRREGACSKSLPGYKRFYSTINKPSNCSSSSDNLSSAPAASYTNPILLKSVIYKENQKRLESTIEQI
jgi:hypothetical protein